MEGFFSGHENNIEKNICQYLDRIANSNSLDPLIKLLKLRKSPDNYVNKAIASVLDSNPSSLEFIYETLYDERDEYILNSILQSLEKMKTEIDTRKLLTNIRIDWIRTGSRGTLRRILIKEGKSSKHVLFEMLQDDEENYKFALECLKEIGVSREEISAIFPKPPMIQVLNNFYKEKDIINPLENLWQKKGNIRRIVPANTDWLEYLIFNIFTCFNFVTMNLAYLQLEGVDIVCFYPETLDLFIIGCTTSVIKDDLVKMDAQIKKIESDMPKLVKSVTITPIVVCSKDYTVDLSHIQYANYNNIKIMQQENIDTLLEMLNTNGEPRKIIEYIKSIDSIGIAS